MSKPTIKPGWNSTGVEPSSTKKSQGWAAGEKPSAAQMNWLFKTVSEWIEHVDADQVKGDTGDAGPQGEKGATGDAGPSGSAALDATTEARIAALESKAKISTPSSVTMPLSYQGTGVASEYNAGNSGSAITVDWSNGVSQAVIVNGNATVSFANPTSGKVYYLRLKSDGVADRNLTFVGANPSISSISNGYTAIISLYYDGSAYVVQKITSLFGPVSGSETKNGYVAGGSNGSSALSTVEKINFNNDLITTIVQSQFGIEINQNGQYVSNANSSGSSHGQGTQSSTHGYRARAAYTALPNVNSQTTSSTHKLSFANDSGAVSSIRTASPWSITLRQAAMQNANAAYQIYTTTSIAKLTFNTDLVSAVSQNTDYGASYSVGFSTSTSGFTWGRINSATGGLKLTFSSETSATTSTTMGVSNDQGGWGEAVDGDSFGYYQKTTAATPVATTYKFNKTTEGFNTLATTLSSGGGAGAATQSMSIGYFCGETRITGTAPTSTSAVFSSIRKINMSTDLPSISGGSLKTARSFAAGFEG